jgi:hypothetical protein
VLDREQRQQAEVDPQALAKGQARLAKPTAYRKVAKKVA